MKRWRTFKNREDDSDPRKTMKKFFIIFSAKGNLGSFLVGERYAVFCVSNLSFEFVSVLKLTTNDKMARMRSQRMWCRVVE